MEFFVAKKFPMKSGFPDIHRHRDALEKSEFGRPLLTRSLALYTDHHYAGPFS